MAEWVEVCPVAEFSEGVRLFVYEGERIAIFKKGENEFYAIADTCSHADASLAEGEVEGYEVSCPKHGARFDLRTGQHLSFPAVTPVQSYPLEVREGVLYIQLERSE